MLALYHFEHNIVSVLQHGLANQPTHQANKNCQWVREIFAKKNISFFQQSCPNLDVWWTSTEDEDGSVVETIQANPAYKFTIQVLLKDPALTPLEQVKVWYAKLTPAQKSACEIQDGNEEIPHYANGGEYWSEAPHVTAHKTRYRINIKPNVVQAIMAKYGGLPGGTQYDFICGITVGSRFTSYPPYFEFDDRSPDKYLFVSSRSQDEQAIDLNSIRF
jgi:hypothetical protein